MKKPAKRRIRGKDAFTVTEVGTLIEGLRSEFRIVSERQISIIEKLDTTHEQVVKNTEDIALLTTAVRTLTKRVDTLAETVDRLTKRVDTLAETVDRLTKRVDTLAENVIKNTEAIAALTKSIDNLVKTKTDREEILTLERRVSTLENKVASLL